MFTTINPATEEVIKNFIEDSDEIIDKKLQLAFSEFIEWSNLSYEDRSKLFINLSELLLSQKQKLSKLITIEMGKPIIQSLAEIEKCSWVCRYFAENSAKFLEDIHIETEYSQSFVTFQPLGVVLAIMPWNFPFWQVFRFAVPTLMAGNTGVLKHSRNTMGCAEEIQKLFETAGFPKGAFVNLVIGSDKVRNIINDKRVSAVTLTGSTPSGREVAKLSGYNVKKTVLELGGSDPYIILKDADLKQTVKTCVTSRLINNGQSCISAKRFIVEDDIYDEFLLMFTAEMEKQIVGNPMDEKTTLGPLARKDLQIELDHQVQRSIDKGCQLILGGKISQTKGFFYLPTILSNVMPGHPVFDEETFGPVAAVVRAKNEKEAIKLANTSNYALGAAIFTSDIEKGKQLARNYLQAGCCFVNDFVKSDPRLPFGGIKESGYGRELSFFGIREFVNIKTVCIK
ncbi:MAG: NAD-dependent succinate-semialdehyde dehydrogenase [Candidatus Kapaibacteriales bacterium]